MQRYLFFFFLTLLENRLPYHLTFTFEHYISTHIYIRKRNAKTKVMKCKLQFQFVLQHGCLNDAYSNKNSPNSTNVTTLTNSNNFTHSFTDLIFIKTHLSQLDSSLLILIVVKWCLLSLFLTKFKHLMCIYIIP